MKKTNKKYSESKGPKMHGVIHVHPKGFAFVSPDDSKSFPEDIFIPKHLKGNAVDGDRVEVIVTPSKKPDKGPEGVVSTVLERGKKQIVGIVWEVKSKGDLRLYIQSLGPSKHAQVKKSDSKNYKVGDRLLLEVDDWGDEKAPAICTPIEKIGTIEDAKTDIPAAIKDFSIREKFPKKVISQVKEYSTKVEKSDLSDRIDFTKMETFTIDPDTAKDFDDALSVTEDKNGHFHLAVHIADVSHYVKENTPLDEEAKMRSNSTYFPGICVPMLPEELSNHLCSLKEKVVRLTITALMEFDQEGTLLSSKIVRGFIKSQKRFTYKQAKQVLDGDLKSPHLEALQKMEKLCYLLKKKRFERGSVDLALPEVVIKVDKKGNPTGYEIVEYDITHQIVEEFMLKANEVVAKEFVDRGEQAIFRIHEPPGDDNLADFFALARTLGFPLPNKVEVKDIQNLFTLAKNTPYAEQLSVAYIRSMKLAIYSKENVGHYGLSLENYCHFTSPIRRYSDLVIHRRLFEKSDEDLTEVAKDCSEKERVSFKAEVSVLTMKKLRLLQSYFKEDPSTIYEATVSKIKPFGIFFEISPIQYEGFIHISELKDDFYEFSARNETLTGQSNGKSYKRGEPIEVMLEDIDLIVMESKWTLNCIPKKFKKRSSKGKKRSKSRRKR
jgi:ribonuclease R